MQNLGQDSQQKNYSQDDQKSCFYVINSILIIFILSQLFTQKEGNFILILLSLAYHGLNIFAAYNLNLYWMKFQKIVSICFGIIHGIIVLVMAFVFIAVIFGKPNGRDEQNKSLAFVVVFLGTAIVSLILLVDILNYKYLNQQITFLEIQDGGYSCQYFGNKYAYYNHQITHPLINQKQNEIELKDIESQIRIQY